MRSNRFLFSLHPPSGGGSVFYFELILFFFFAFKGQNKSEADIAVSKCVLNLCSGPVCLKPSASVEVIGIQDYADDGDSLSEIHGELMSKDKFWSGHETHTVQVTVEDVPSSQCYSVTDPHFLTFDGKSYDYYSTGTFVMVKSTNRIFEVQARIWLCGSDPRPLSCNCGFAAREDNDLVKVDMCHGSFMTTLPEVTVKNLNSSLDVKAKVLEANKGRVIKVEFPSGAFIQAYISRSGLTISVQSSALDFKNTRGLCGVFDGDPDNDYNDIDGRKMNLKPILGQVDEFVETWRITPGESFFDKAPTPVPDKDRKHFCNCAVKKATDRPGNGGGHGMYGGPFGSSFGGYQFNHGHNLGECRHGSCPDNMVPEKCEKFEHILFENILTYSDITNDVKSDYRQIKTTGYEKLKKFEPTQLRDSPGAPFLKSFGKNIYWKKSEPLQVTTASPFPSEAAEEDYNYDYEDAFSDDIFSEIGTDTTYIFPGDLFPVTPSTEEPQFPTPKGLTKENITQLCENTIKNSMITKVFAPYFSNHTLYPLQTCILDVTLSDDITWAPHSLPFLSFQAEMLAVKQRKRKIRDTSILHSALNCPNMCSRQGVCLKYGCVCNPRRAADDCSVQEDRPPTVSHATEFGHCDSAKFECRRVRVVGSNFIQGSDLQCAFYNIFYNQSMGIWTEVESKKFEVSEAIYLGPEDVLCTVPEVIWKPSPSFAAWMISVTNDKRQYSVKRIQYSVYDFRCYTCSTSENVTCTKKSQACIINTKCFPDKEVNPSNKCERCISSTSANSWTFHYPIDETKNLIFPSHLGFVDGENITFPLSTKLRIEIVSSPPDMELTTDNELKWTANYAKYAKGIVIFNVLGGCKTRSSYNISYNVRQCLCKNRGQCVGSNEIKPFEGNYKCLCIRGFTGRFCEIDIDDCASFPCIYGDCQDLVDSFQCNCFHGYSGKFCEQLTDPCALKPCYSTVQCTTKLHDFFCGPCPRGLTGNGVSCTIVDRDACKKKPCFPGVSCSMTSLGLKCGDCPKGYKGDGFSCYPFCRRPCHRNQKCVLPGQCRCKTGYTGSRCHIPICKPKCLNSGRCISPSKCKCRPGFIGKYCQIGVCKHQCQNGGTCRGNDRCACMYGYLGKLCEKPACPMGCDNGGVCVAANKCLCKKGWSGYRCHMPICDPMCMNGGVCKRPGLCKCRRGFRGPTCEEGLCHPPCKNNGHCMRHNMCICNNGWYGYRCQLPVCEPMCLHGGKCWRPNKCSCASGWSGSECSKPICIGGCKNGGRCARPNTCSCNPGYKGSHCHQPICKRRCRFGGKCVAPNKCRCRAGHSGELCSIRPRRHSRKLRKRRKKRYRYGRFLG